VVRNRTFPSLLVVLVAVVVVTADFAAAVERVSLVLSMNGDALLSARTSFHNKVIGRGLIGVGSYEDRGAVGIVHSRNGVVPVGRGGEGRGRDRGLGT
jgi:hypothetical protein